MKISAGSVLLSKRVKFPHNVEYVTQLGNSCGVLVVLDNQVSAPRRKVLILTHEDKIVSFSQYVNLEAMYKYSL